MSVEISITVGGQPRTYQVEALTERDRLFAAIASRWLGVPTLRVRGWDRADFHECHVDGIKAALEAAFEAGRASGSE